MITGKNRTSYIYKKEIQFSKEKIKINHSVENTTSIGKIYLSSDLVPMYVAVSECFEQSSLNNDWKVFHSTGKNFTLREKFQ